MRCAVLRTCQGCQCSKCDGCGTGRHVALRECMQGACAHVADAVCAVQLKERSAVCRAEAAACLQVASQLAGAEAQLSSRQITPATISACKPDLEEAARQRAAAVLNVPRQACLLGPASVLSLDVGRERAQT